VAIESAGVLLYRRKDPLELFLIHPGGPYWAKKDLGAWSIPKGEIQEGESPLTAAKREFAEETGSPVDGLFIDLGSVRLRSGKRIHGFAVEGDCDAASVESNLFSIEWPPRSGQIKEFPEVDRASWFGVDEARQRIHAGQAAFIERLLERLGETSGA
jgi:predicted NUDIX family NTP pyrophosphohydrolase